MFSYNKFLEYPINIKNKNTRLANIVATQYGGAYQNVRVPAPLCKGSCQRS